MHNRLRHVRTVLVPGALVLAGACGGGANEGASNADSLARADSVRELDATEALRFMAAADQGEVQAAQIAARLASTAEVRRFAQMLWREHSRSGREVADLARQMEINLQANAPPGPLLAGLRTMSQQTVQSLNSTPRGAAFDRAYIDSQIRMHQTVLQGLQRIAAGGGRGVGADVAPGAGVDVTMPATSATPAKPATPAPAPRPGTERARRRDAATPQEAARMAIPRLQEHLAGARELQSRLAGGAR